MVYGLLILLGVGLAGVAAIMVGVVARLLVRPERRTAGRAAALGLPLGPEEMGAPHQVIALRDADGGPVEGWALEGQDPAGPAVVVVHGWGDSRYGALLWWRVLGPAVSRAVFFDLRGHGDSPRRRFGWGEPEAADVLAAAERFADLAGVDEVVLAGYSVGGAVAIAAARLAAERAAGAGGGARVAAVVGDSVYRRPIALVRRGLRRQGVAAVVAWPAAALALGWLRLWGGHWACSDVAESAARVRTPLLLMHGALDDVAPPADARAIADAAPAGRLELFEGANHLEPSSADPQRYTLILRRFFAELAA